ncbi:MFS transporter [Porphyrobacter algicida]|uniref:MFS transporter n=1 Tax=Qipengyuania algicida TaxID=1836209 RepID=A0A845AJK5_9SPHN|nr:MFS transporter [Qipengyuania algicida]MXP29619.1 MFS transporter [Qipengyuania algicida]
MAKAPAEANRANIKVAMMASAGAAVEWYDFFIYGTAAALVFPHLFFPETMPPLIALLASFSTFAVGFVARPVGGMIFGHYGDRHGRKRALVLAMFVMGLATCLIGLLPSYHSIGIFAPLALIVLRFAQGLAVGGQWGGAALLAIESAPAGRRGFYGSMVQVGVPLGVVFANTMFLIISALTSDDAFIAWGWRIGFIASVALIFIGLAIQNRVEEPAVDPQEDMAASTENSPLMQAAREHWREIILAGGAFVANNTCFYVAITYAVAYGTGTVGLSRDLLLLAVMASSILMIPVLPLCGWISDRLGRRGIFQLGALLAAGWAFAIFPLMDSASPVAVMLAIAIEMIFLSMMYGPQAALFAELFPRSVRYSGASLGYQLGAVVGGGFAPIIATALFAEYHSTFPIAVYLSAMCLVSFVSVALLGKRRFSREFA